jgi:hypothetical protein
LMRHVHCQIDEHDVLTYHLQRPMVDFRLYCFVPRHSKELRSKHAVSDQKLTPICDSPDRNHTGNDIHRCRYHSICPYTLGWRY